VSTFSGVSNWQAALIQQVMSLTEAQIGALPPEQRSQIIALRQQIMSGQM
jgi:Transcription termination and cleavage factor C-terminal